MTFGLRSCIFRIRNFLGIVIIFTILIVYRENKLRVAKFSSLIPNDAMKYLGFNVTDNPPKNVFRLRRLIKERNARQTVLNIDTFGPVRSNTPIFVIQMKKITDPLKFLLASLNEVRGIEEVLLIFSHSFFDENIDEFIRMIDFCRVMQLFYPYSIQTHPHSFPGLDPNDCTKYTSILNCTGTPDIFGKYRNPLLVESKHHWWWTANTIFENLTFSESYDGTVVFLDDDLYLIEDFLYMVQCMKDAADSQYSHSEFLSLGSSDLSFTRRTPHEDDFYRAYVATWNPQFHSSALAFDTTGWNRIVTHYDLFCSIDDHSWSRSLLQISLNLKDNSDRMLVMYPKVPRGFKVSDSQTIMNNVVVDNVLAIIGMQVAAKDVLYPAIIEVYTEIEFPNEELDDLFNIQASGGWNDPRDKMLCANLTVRKIKKELFESAVEFRQQHLVI